MKPYYEDDLTQIFCGDAYEIAPELAADLVMTDPDVTTNPSLSEDCDTVGLIVCADNHAVFDYQIGDLLLRRKLVAKHPTYRYLACHVYEDSDPLLLSETKLFAVEREKYVHPGQKPLAVLRWFLEVLNPVVVLDPFCGSGTTLVAAKELGIPAIGIDIEERFCEMAAVRLGDSCPTSSFHFQTPATTERSGKT